MALLEVDEIQATAILDMQLRRLAALERQRIIDELAEIEMEIADLKDILAKPERQRQIIIDELAEIVEKWGDERRTRIIPFDGEVSMEDLIAREDVVVTITRDRLREAHEGRPLPLAEAGRQGRQRRHAASGRHRSTLLRHAPRTTGSCSSRTRAGSTGRRRTNCPRRAALPRASTSPTCSPSSRTSRSPRSSRSRTTRSPRTWCSPRRTAW